MRWSRWVLWRIRRARSSPPCTGKNGPAEWRYGTSAHRVALIDAGHVGQNLYLACEAIGCGACAVAAIDQPVADRLCQLDGQEEFILYAAAVGLSDPEKNQAGNQQLYAGTIAESDAIAPLEK